MPAKFYADEHVPAAVSQALKRRGIDILTVQEARLRGRSDKEQLQYAFLQQRVIITHDSDFLILVQKINQKHPGILFFTSQVQIGKAIEEIERIWLTYTAEDLCGVTLFLPMKDR